MQFENFGKVKLFSEKSIRHFLGKENVKMFENYEVNIKDYILRQLKINNQECDFDDELTIYLLNAHSDRGYPLVAIIYSSYEDCIDENKIKYAYTTYDGTCETVHRARFDTKQEMLEFVSQFENVKSSMEICIQSDEIPLDGENQ